MRCKTTVLTSLSSPTGFHSHPHFNPFNIPTTHTHHTPTHFILHPTGYTRQSRPNTPARGRKRAAKSYVNFFQFLPTFPPLSPPHISCRPVAHSNNSSYLPCTQTCARRTDYFLGPYEALRAHYRPATTVSHRALWRFFPSHILWAHITARNARAGPADSLSPARLPCGYPGVCVCRPLRV